MIGSLLKFVADQLNSAVCAKLNLPDTDRKVILSPLVKTDGSLAVSQKNVLILDLVNIKKDGLINSNVLPRNPKNAMFEDKFPPLYLNLDLLIAAHFDADQFKAGLDVLSMAMAIFQGKPMWDAQNTSNFPSGTDRLAFDIETLDFHQQSHLWGYIGAKYMPSVVYKMRMAIIDDKRVIGEIPPIETIIVESSRKGDNAITESITEKAPEDDTATKDEH